MKKIFLWLIVLNTVTLSFAQENPSKIGIYAGLTQSTFFRSNFPSNPFSSGSLFAYEFGADIPVLQKGNLESRLYVGYSLYGARETFADDVQQLETQIKFNAIRIAALPIIYSFGPETYKLSAGIGGYAAYNLGQKFSSEPDNVFVEEELFADFNYGLQVQLGVRYEPFILNLNLYNSLNKISKAFIGGAFLKTKGSSLTLSYMF